MKEILDCPMIVRAVDAGGFVRGNTAFRRKVDFTDAELARESLFHWLDADDHARVRAALDTGNVDCRVRHRTRSGDFLPLTLRMTNRDADTYVLGRGEQPVNRSDSAGDGGSEATVRGTLHAIARIIEEQVPEFKCSILLVEDGHFVKGAGPSLPDEYNAAIDGFAIGPTVGSCGTAIYWNVPVIVEDIQADPLWRDLAELAGEAGVAACWSHPFTSSRGRVLGALAFYAPEPRTPTSEELRLLRAAAQMTGLAVERGRTEQALREKHEREVELESQLRQAAKMEALGVLAGGVAHDFNNVLATILGNAELALETQQPNESIRMMLGEIIKASERAGSFCKQLLAYSGRSTVSTTTFELGTLLPQLGTLVQPALSKKTKLAYALHDEPIFVDGDENQLLQVIMNLVINAADALGDEAGNIEVGTEVAHYDAETLRLIAPRNDLSPGEYVRLTVSDDGCGMDAATIDRIFDPFFTTKATGHGLGLAAVKGIVFAHRGTIQIDSQPGTGTTFTVLLPSVESPYSGDAEFFRRSAASARRRILVVDDDDNLRAVICKRLTHSGFDVVEARDGQQAIDVFRTASSAIDCVLLDLNMPKLSGDEVLREMKSVRSGIPIVLMSGYAEQEILDRFDPSDLAGVLQKPVRASDIVTAIYEAIV